MKSLARSAGILIAALITAPPALATPYDLVYTDRIDVTLCENGCGITLAGCDFAVLVNTGTAPITVDEMRTARFNARSSESTITLTPWLNIYTSEVPSLDPWHARGAVCPTNAFLATLLLPGEALENIQGNQFIAFNISRDNGSTYEGPVTFDVTMDMGSFRTTFRIEATLHLGPHEIAFLHGARVQGVPGPPPTIAAELDIMPGDCPNVFNPNSSGPVPVVLVGTPTLNVRNVDLARVRLEGFAPLQTAIDDVARAFSTTPCDCVDQGADGVEDLSLRFSSQDVAAALGPTVPGGGTILALTGLLTDGTPFEARDCLSITGPPPPDSIPNDSTIAGMVVRRDPSSGGAQVSYTLAADASVDLSVYDVGGRRIEPLVRAHQTRGPHQIQWRAEGYRPGVYFFKLAAAEQIQMRRFVLLR